MSGKGQIPSNLEMPDSVITDDEPLSSPGLTNEQLGKAKRAMDTISSFEGSLSECREKLMSVDALSILEGSMPKSSIEVVVESQSVKDEIQEEARVEFEINASELYGEELDWNADVPELEEPGEVPIDYPSQTTCTTESTVQNGPVPPPHQADWEQFMLQNFSTLYSSLKQGIDATLAANLEIKTAFHGLVTEVRMVRDEQIKLGARLTEISTKVDSLHNLTKECQYDLQEVRQEVSICTAGFSKINSALLQMNTLNVPQGAIPSISNYNFEMNPTVASAKEGARTTPLAYTREKLTELMTQMAMPSDKISIMVTMLENRTPRSFAMLLPQLNPHSCLSDDDAKRLIDMADIKDGAGLKQAFLHLRALYSKQPPENARTSTSPTPCALPSNQKASLTIKENRTVSSTKIKRCANPFANAR